MLILILHAVDEILRQPHRKGALAIHFSQLFIFDRDSLSLFLYYYIIIHCK